MNAISHSSVLTKTSHFATLTALAAACTLSLATTAHAADTAAAVTTSTAVPSAIDSSRRIIRSAKPTTAISPAQQRTQESVAATPATTSTPAATNTSTAQPASTTRVYEPGPMTATGIDLRTGQLSNIPTPQVQVSRVSFLPTVLIPQQKGLGTDKLDVSLLDDFIKDVSPNARHYPPNFPNRSQRHYTREKIKVLSEWIDPYAKSPNASYEVLIRAAKLNGMGRNLDLGSDYTVRGGNYVDRAIKIQPDSGEANFLYGVMLSEGGGFKEGQKYLNRAVALGYTEAEQSLAQSELLSDRRDSALERLRRLAQQHPDNDIIRQQIKLVEEGKFYIWDIAAPNVNVKPTV